MMESPMMVGAWLFLKSATISKVFKALRPWPVRPPVIVCGRSFCVLSCTVGSSQLLSVVFRPIQHVESYTIIIEVGGESTQPYGSPGLMAHHSGTILPSPCAGSVRVGGWRSSRNKDLLLFWNGEEGTCFELDSKHALN